MQPNERHTGSFSYSSNPTPPEDIIHLEHQALILTPEYDPLSGTMSSPREIALQVDLDRAISYGQELMDRINELHATIDALKEDQLNAQNELAHVDAKYRDKISKLEHETRELRHYEYIYTSSQAEIQNLKQQVQHLSSTSRDLEDKCQRMMTQSYFQEKECKKTFVSKLTSHKSGFAGLGEGITKCFVLGIFLKWQRWLLIRQHNRALTDAEEGFTLIKESNDHLTDENIVLGSEIERLDGALLKSKEECAKLERREIAQALAVREVTKELESALAREAQVKIQLQQSQQLLKDFTVREANSKTLLRVGSELLEDWSKCLSDKLMAEYENILKQFQRDRDLELFQHRYRELDQTRLDSEKSRAIFEKELIRIQKEVQVLKNDLQSKSQELHSLREENNQLEQRNEKLQSTHAQHSNEENALNQKCIDLEEKLRHLSNAMTECVQQSTDKSAKIEQLTQVHIPSLEQRISTLEQKYEEVRNEKEKGEHGHTQEKESLMKENSKLQRDNESLRTALNFRDEQEKRWEEEAKRASKKLEFTEGQYKDLLSNFHRLEQEVTDRVTIQSALEEKLKFLDAEKSSTIRKLQLDLKAFADSEHELRVQNAKLVADVKSRSYDDRSRRTSLPVAALPERDQTEQVTTLENEITATRSAMDHLRKQNAELLQQNQSVAVERLWEATARARKAEAESMAHQLKLMRVAHSYENERHAQHMKYVDEIQRNKEDTARILSTSVGLSSSVGLNVSSARSPPRPLSL